MSYGMLNNGMESMGAMRRGYDKYGKRMHMGSATRDMSTKDKTMSAPSCMDKTDCVPGDMMRTRKNVGI